MSNGGFVWVGFLCVCEEDAHVVMSDMRQGIYTHNFAYIITNYSHRSFTVRVFTFRPHTHIGT